MLENDVLSGLLALLSQFGVRAAGSLAILVVGIFVSRRVGKLAGRLSERSGVDETTALFLGNLARWGLIAIVALIAVNNLGIEISAILAALGAAGLAIGLALTGALANLAAGIIIAVLRPFKIGDWISAGDSEGRVTEIDAFSTSLVTLDHETIVIPNSDLVGGQIVNYSTEENVRVEIPLVVALDADLDEVTRVLMNAANACERALADPPGEVQIVHYGTAATEVQLEVTVEAKDREDVIFDINRAIADSYGKGGFKAPLQVVRVHPA